MKYLVTLTLSLLLWAHGAHGQPVPAHAQGLAEKLYTVPVSDGGLQHGVLSGKSGVQGQDLLAVLLPGYPSVVRPVMDGGVMVSSKLTGNFLIRSRRFLADERILTLVVDCNTHLGDYCTPAYQASRQRQSDVQALIDTVRKDHPSLKEVWLLGTSMGTISSAFMALHAPGQYAGVVHTASITDLAAAGLTRSLRVLITPASPFPNSLCITQTTPAPRPAMPAHRRFPKNSVFRW